MLGGRNNEQLQAAASVWWYQELWFQWDIENDFWLTFQEAWLRKGQNGTSGQMLSFSSGSAELKGVVIEYASAM